MYHGELDAVPDESPPADNAGGPVDAALTMDSRPWLNMPSSGALLYSSGDLDVQDTSPPEADVSAPGLWQKIEFARGVPPRAAHSCDLVKERYIIIFGGWNGLEALSDLYVLDTESWKWTKVVLPNCPARRNNHATVIHGNTILVHGGHDGNKWLSDLHMLTISDGTSAPNPVADDEIDMKLDMTLTWSSITATGQVPRPRACHSLSKVKKLVYLFGGYDGSTCFSDVEILALDTMTWSTPSVCGSAPRARNAHCMTVVGHKLYLSGGISGRAHLADFHIFDTTNLTWCEITLRSIPLGLRGHSSTLIGNSIFLFGGYDGKERSNDIFIFHTKHRTWHQHTFKSSADTPSGRQRHSSILLPSKRMFIFGGFNGKQWLNDAYILDASKLMDPPDVDGNLHSLSKNMEWLVGNPLFSDVQFMLLESQTTVHAHRSILACRSLYFRSMFIGDMQESVQNTIEIRTWTKDGFMEMLRFLYCGVIATRGDSPVVFEVMSIADQMGITNLLSLCENVLLEVMNVENICTILTHADKCNAKNLKSRALQFIYENADDLSETINQLASTPSLLLEVAKLCLSAAGSQNKNPKF